MRTFRLGDRIRFGNTTITGVVVELAAGYFSIRPDAGLKGDDLNNEIIKINGTEGWACCVDTEKAPA